MKATEDFTRLELVPVQQGRDFYLDNTKFADVQQFSENPSRTNDKDLYFSERCHLRPPLTATIVFSIERLPVHHHSLQPL